MQSSGSSLPSIYNFYVMLLLVKEWFLVNVSINPVKRASKPSNLK